jgi:hypothetical protein
MLDLFQVLGANRRKLRAPQRTCETHQQQGPAAPGPPRRSSAIGASSSRSTVRSAARFFCGLGASRRMPALVSDTSAESVGEGIPAARYRKRIAAVRSFGVLPALP